MSTKFSARLKALTSNKTFVYAAVGLIAFLTISILLLSTGAVTPTPNPSSSWKVIYAVTPEQKAIDKLGATWVHNQWGCEIYWDPLSAVEEDYNHYGENIIVIGNGGRGENTEGLLEIHTGDWFAKFSISKPEWASNVYIYEENNKLIIHTPKREYTMSDENNYALVFSGWSLMMNRFVVLDLGWSGFASQAGARYIVEHLGQDLKVGYAVIKYTGSIPSGLTEEDWLALSMNQFAYLIVESG